MPVTCENCICRFIRPTRFYIHWKYIINMVTSLHDLYWLEVFLCSKTINMVTYPMFVCKNMLVKKVWHPLCCKLLWRQPTSVVSFLSIHQWLLEFSCGSLAFSWGWVLCPRSYFGCPVSWLWVFLSCVLWQGSARYMSMFMPQTNLHNSYTRRRASRSLSIVVPVIRKST